MEKQKEHRACPRFQCEIPVVILRDMPMILFSTLILNYSQGGMYFEIYDPLETGAYIMIKLEKITDCARKSLSTWGYRPAEVCWCRQIEEGDSRRYGCGIRYVNEK